jgi:hypothetical protein
MPVEILSNAPIKRDPPVILIEGFPGSGKTTLALQFPNPWLLNCDLNHDGPISFLQKEKRLPEKVKISHIPYHDDHTSTDPKLVAPEDRLDRLFKEIKAAVADPWTKTIIIDSMSTIDTFIYDKVKKQLGITTGTPFRIQDWRPFRDYLMTLIGHFRYCGKTVIVLCHVESVTNDKNVIIGYKPMISTKVGEIFAGFFTDMWLMTAKPAPANKVEFVLKTTRTDLYDLKNAYSMPAEIKNPMYEEINKYLKQ